VFGGVSVRMRFFVFVAVSVGVDPGVGALEKGNPSRWWWLLCGLASGGVAVKRRLLAIEGADSLGGAEGVADFSDGALGVGAVIETCTIAGGALTSAGADMAAGKLGRQIPDKPRGAYRQEDAMRYSP